MFAELQRPSNDLIDPPFNQPHLSDRFLSRINVLVPAYFCTLVRRAIRTTMSYYWLIGCISRSAVESPVICVHCTRWGIITGPLKLCYFAVFGIKIPTNKCEIMPHAMSLNLPTLLTWHTVVHHSSTPTYIPISLESEKLFVDGRTYYWPI